jgi:N-acetylglucosamine kinase-like BadF-type ATPase
MSFILGLDGGATKTRAMILNTDTNEIIESVSGSSNYMNVGIELAKKKYY